MDMLDFTEYKNLTEKQLLINNGKKYGQVVFMAGGGGSGKGFATAKFMESEKFKVINIDDFKVAYNKLRKLGLNLGNPDDANTIHELIKNKRFVHKTLLGLFKASLVSGSGKKGTLPNIIIDGTLRSADNFYLFLPFLQNMGYETVNMHLVWVLTNYKLALRANNERDRRVNPEVILNAHKGVRQTITDVILGISPINLGGGIYVILNNRENTVYYLDAEGNPIESKNKRKNLTIKGFSYLTVKKPGRNPENNKEVMDQLFRWIRDNTPKKDLGGV